MMMIWDVVTENVPKAIINHQFDITMIYAPAMILDLHSFRTA